MTIVQHPKEQRHAKNTARLARLCANEISLIREDDHIRMARLCEQVHDNASALVYPSHHSVAIEHHTKSNASYRHWVFLDGSWKQAYGMLQRHCFLRALPAFHFSAAPDSDYAIRHTHINNSLSTLEAIAYCMQAVYGDDVAPLFKLQRAFIDSWQSPLAHRR